MRSCLRLLACLAAACCSSAFAQSPNPAAQVQNTMAQRMQACTLCHGKEGRALNTEYVPRIAGKPAGYLYNQLQNFKSGRRHNDAMGHLLAQMSDDYLRAIAAHFAELDLPYPPAAALPAEPTGTAQALVFRGAPQRQIPACVACHGQAMAGQLPAMPGLLTLPADYLMAQLGAWRTGLRKAKAPDCMAEIAKRLTPEEIGALARWLSAQTLPLGTKPQAASVAALPMACGSGQP
ncbi:MAG: c-type cytochrome [Rubrivivax sp.]